MGTNDTPVGARILPMGDNALLLETSDIDAVLALHYVLAAHVATGEDVWGQVDDVVPAARTVLLVARPSTDLNRLAKRIRSAIADVAVPNAAASEEAAADEAPSEETVDIPTRYDGSDLEEVARLTRLSPAEVVAAHTGMPWRVGFGGFAPGFAYLVGGDPRLRVPRRSEPRTRVPAGSVALAGEFSAVYPRESPGGWQLIGTSDIKLWDATQEPPALLKAGQVVRFVDESGQRS